MPGQPSKRVYLDNAATEKLLPCVKQAMIRAMDAELGNASALHAEGHRAYVMIEEARKQVAQLIGAEPEEIIFTSGGTEANNTVMETFRGRDISVSSIEHPSVLAAAKARAQSLKVVPVDRRGRVDTKGINYVDSDLVSVMLANNELGTIEAVKEIAKCCKNNNTFCHTDATQAVGKIKVDVKDLGVDYLSFSAHKIGGPIGVGVLYTRKGVPFTNLLYGGKQEAGRRAGTSNILGIIGLGAAAKWCWDNWSCKQWAKVGKLRDELRRRILAEVPYSSCNSPEEGCLPGILNMSFRAAEGESIQLYLDAEGIIVSTGSACAAGDIRPSHVLTATRGDAEVAHSSIRFSLGLETRQEDIDQVMTVLPGIVRKLQDMSTVKVFDIPCEEPKTCSSAPERLKQDISDTLERSL